MLKLHETTDLILSCLLLVRLSSRADTGRTTIANKHTYTNYALVQYFCVLHPPGFLITKKSPASYKTDFRFFQIVKEHPV